MRFIDPQLLAHADPEELAEYEELLRLEYAMSSPLAFAEYCSEAERYPHLVYLDNVLMAMFEHRLYKSGIGPVGVKVGLRKWVHPETGEPVLTQLGISMPPRHGKSYLVSEHLPAWWLVTNPDQPVILSSYEAEFAASWGEKARNLLEEHPEFGVVVDKESRAKANWRLKGRRGGMSTAGTGGPITGKGAGLLVIDDPIKNAEEAMSSTERENADHWYQSTFRTRGNNKGDIGHFKVMMFTRWHEDDLGGRIFGREGASWFVINLPAIAFDTNADGVSVDPDTDEPDALGRHPGEALCADLATVEELEAIKAGGVQWFTAMYQGKPNIQGGGIFKRDTFLRYRLREQTYELTDGDGAVTYIPEGDVYLRFGVADLAATDKTRSDWTAVGVFDITRGHKLILRHISRRKLESPDHEQFVRDIYKTYGLKFLAVEDQTYGKSLIQHLIRGGGVVVRPLKTKGEDKTGRAIPAGQFVENGQFYVPDDSVDWVPAFIDELCKFPNASHDDQLDVMSYAVKVWETTARFSPRNMSDTTMQGRVDAAIAAMGKKKVHRQIDLGRW